MNKPEKQSKPADRQIVSPGFSRWEAGPCPGSGEYGTTRRMHHLKAFTVAIALLWSLAVQAGDPGPESVVLKEQSPYPFSLGLHMDYFIDRSKNLAIEEISSREYARRFRPLEEDTPNFGYTRAAIWLRFSLENATDARTRWLLEVNNPLIDKVDFYFPRKGGGFLRKHGGEAVSYNDREVRYANPVVTVDIPKGERSVYYVRYQDEGTVICPLRLWSPESFLDSIEESRTVLGIQYGMVIVIIFYNLFLFLSVRDRGYAFYVLFVVFIGLALSI